MPKLNNFRINNKGTLKNIMNPRPPAPPQSDQGKMESDIMKYLMKESKKEALAEHLPKKSSRSRKLPQVKLPPPSKSSTTNIGNKGIVKEDLVAKILKYQGNKRFGTIINKELGIKYTRAQLTKYSVDNLETILHRIRTHLNTRNMDQVFEHMAKVTAQGYEDLVSGFGYNIEGFSDMLLANPAFHDAFERWKIERKIPDIPPSLQLGYIIASTTYIAHLNAKPLEQKVEPPPAQKKPVASQLDKKNPDKSTQKIQPGDLII